jgi:uncharacterized protein
MPNQLIHETSPYLLQHAHNPVNWYPWGGEAIKKAKQENKPILVSIGYAACHWCHVMEHESFENEATAKLMNDYFINIKIDREERPDVDHTYMDAVQAMTGQGGWPLNVFLTPDLKPFFGGTYFPPQKAHGRGSWSDVLVGIHMAWQERKHEVIQQAETLTEHLIKANSFGTIVSQEEFIPTKENLALINATILKNADTVDGGFGSAPKFPQLHTISFLLHHYYYSQNEAALQQAILSLQKMINGGIYDQLGGGLARYSTDNTWLVPHFEKMLYDNALFVAVLADAYQITKNEIFKNAIVETLDFVQRDLMHSNYLFYAAMDADSEGIEGKFYCWTATEIDTVLNPTEAELFKEYYNVTAKGNWTEPHHNINTNILHITQRVEDFAAQHNKSDSEISERILNCKEKLLAIRYKRIPPLTDDKCLLSWNALMNKAFTKAYEATLEESYLQIATKNMEAMLQNYIMINDGMGNITIFHTHKNGVATINAFLEDVAYLIDALLTLNNHLQNNDYKVWIEKLIQYSFDHYSSDGAFFYFTNKQQENTIVRKKEIYDGATPSGNSIMAINLYLAANLCNQPQWHAHATAMLANLSNAILKHPGSFCVWANAYQMLFYGINELSFNENKFDEMRKQFYTVFIPSKLYKLNKDLSVENPIMLCNNQKCQLPVDNAYNIDNHLKKMFKSL